MNIAQIEYNLQELLKSFSKDNFIYDLILAYGLPKASVSRIKKGDLNLSKKDGEICWKKKLFFRDMTTDDLSLFPKAVNHDDLQQTIDSLKKDPKVLKHAPRFIIVTDFKYLLAVDTKTSDTIDIKIKELAKRYDFFLPWAGMEKAQHQNENPADVKAAERMAKLYDEIKKINSTKTPEDVHSLNVFLTRLLFCFFAEDTGIFEDGLFVHSISSHTQADGSDLDGYIDRLFHVLNTKGRNNLPSYLAAFPYVNGGLFKQKHKVPKFNHRSRQAIIESGELDWAAINPDIFGSMIQAVVTPEHRSGLGMHYTSVPNIMKVINPLFLDELNEEFEKNKSNKPKLLKLLDRISKIKIFDPACGSGNFLIVAYKELRKLEIKIIKHINGMAISRISLSQFYGIEIDDFAHEVAILSLWLAEHQMNVEFFKELGKTEPTLPLKDAGNITQGNACSLDWEKVCPKSKDDEIYILGNPPYLGARNQSKEQKQDMQIVCGNIKDFNGLDYIACWFLKGSLFIKDCQAECAFVSTNSICQGEQASFLWPSLIGMGVEIGFAYQSFKWTNNAKNKAGVTCIIVGIRRIKNKLKSIFNGTHSKFACNISPYLVENSNTLVFNRRRPLSNLPFLVYGNQPIEGGYLKLTQNERDNLISADKKAERFIRPLIGGDEFLSGNLRYCLWIEDEQLPDAMAISEINIRINKVKSFRQKGGEVAASLAERPHQFRYRKEAKNNFIIVPCTTSERRNYLTCGFFDAKYITHHSVQVIYDSDPYIFGVISSLIHMVWVKAVGGQLETRIRYSCELCYNTFPFPEIAKTQKDTITNLVYNILAEREKYSEKTIAKLYDPEEMPKGLHEAHHQLDQAVERCYRSKPFESDEERLEYLFKLYEQMITEEKQNSGELSLFDEPPNAKKTKRKQHA